MYYFCKKSISLTKRYFLRTARVAWICADSRAITTILQMTDRQEYNLATPATKSVDGAGGVPGACWYVAIVNHNAEHAVSRALNQAGYSTYVADQKELRVWRDGRRRHVNRVVIPSTIFIYCTEEQRRRALTVPGVHRFLMNRAVSGGSRPATVPDSQIERLRFMLGASDSPVEFVSRPFSPGTRVTVVRGSLRGLEGEVVYGAANADSPGATPARLVISLDRLGYATVAISPLDLQPATA